MAELRKCWHNFRNAESLVQTWYVVFGKYIPFFLDCKFRISKQQQQKWRHHSLRCYAIPLIILSTAEIERSLETLKRDTLLVWHSFWIRHFSKEDNSVPASRPKSLDWLQLPVTLCKISSIENGGMDGFHARMLKSIA